MVNVCGFAIGTGTPKKFVDLRFADYKCAAEDAFLAPQQRIAIT
jgi:hypothetical protein